MVARFLILSVICLAWLLSKAQDKEEFIIYMKEDFRFPYNMGSADQKWELPNKLVEISGLGYIDPERLACVQDEKGNIYIYNLGYGDIERKIDFAHDGDYEGLEVIGDDIWIIKSNGNLFWVRDFMDDEKKRTIPYETPLSKKNEPEGICRDPVSGNLFISCKGYPFIDSKEGKDIKAVFTFDMDSRLLENTPSYLIALDDIKDAKDYNTMTRIGLIILSTLDESKGDMTFQPSGISVHPLTGDIYILGAVGNLMLVLDRNAEIKALIELKSSKFIQPEGICFSPGGDLYIASEGKDRKATIQHFRMY
jgi:uncharacterized protein YjiK